MPRTIGLFTVKEGHNRHVFLALEPRGRDELQLTLELQPGTLMQQASDLAAALNKIVVAARTDSYK